MYEDIFQTPYAINGFVKSYIAELKAIQTPTAVGVRAPQARGNRWIAPPQGLVKINVDAAVSRGVGTATAVCRDGSGAYLGSFVFVIRGLTGPASLEL